MEHILSHTIICIALLTSTWSRLLSNKTTKTTTVLKVITHIYTCLYLLYAYYFMELIKKPVFLILYIIVVGGYIYLLVLQRQHKKQQDKMEHAI